MKKKTIKIFALPSHATPDRTSGVDFARIIQPMKHLNGYEDNEVIFKTRIWSPKDIGKTDWQKIAKAHDIIYLNYIGDAWQFAAMGCMARKYGKKIVMDLDDALNYVKKDNSAYEAYKPGGENITNLMSMLNEVDAISVTNKYLRNVLLRETTKKPEQFYVLDNFIDLNLYNFRPKFRDERDINILWFGSTSHFIDLQHTQFVEGMDKVMKRYPNVNFITIGAFVPDFKKKWGQRYQNGFGHQDLYTWVKEKYPTFIEQADIVIAPLSDTVYDKAKSAIKRWEVAAAIKPFVGERIRQYEESIEEGVDGLLAGTSDEWYQSIAKLIEDKELRRIMAEKAFARLEKQQQMKDNVWRYAEMFRKVLS